MAGVAGVALRALSVALISVQWLWGDQSTLWINLSGVAGLALPAAQVEIQSAFLQDVPVQAAGLCETCAGMCGAGPRRPCRKKNLN
jgi:hypothetical protein